MKHLVIKDIHNSGLYCFTNPLELGTRVSLSHRQSCVSIHNITKSCVYLQVLTYNSAEEFAIREEIGNAFDKSIANPRELISSSQVRADKSPISKINITSQQNNCNIRLSSINLRSFDGNYTNWRSFRILY